MQFVFVVENGEVMGSLCRQETWAKQKAVMVAEEWKGRWHIFKS